MKPYNIYYVTGTRSGIGAHTFIDLAWKNAIQSAGHIYNEIPSNMGIEAWEHLLKLDIDILLIQNYPSCKEYIQVLVLLKKRGVFIAHVIDNEGGNVLGSNELNDAYASIFFGEIELEGASKIIKTVGVDNYWVLPCAADGRFHTVTDLHETSITHDFAFLGSRRTNKSYAFSEYMRPLINRKGIKCNFNGPYWSFKDYPLAFVQRLSNKFNLSKISRSVAFKRLTVPLELEREAYAKALISLNFHERDKVGHQDHIIVNGRTFKVLASGGVLLTDRVLPMERYLDKNEYCTFETIEEFFEKISYLMSNRADRIRMRELGSKRVHNEHLQLHRLQDLIAVFNSKQPRHMHRSF